MKRILLLIIILATSFAYAEEINTKQKDDILLELNQPQKTINLSRPQHTKDLNYDKTGQSQQLQDYSKQNPNTKRSAKFNKSKKIKDVSVGTQSTHTTTSDSYNSTNTVYTEYEKKNFKINTSYTKNTTPNQNNQDKGSISVTPEYKINKHLSVQNKYSTGLNDNSQKNEVNLKLKPFKDDRMDMGVGAGQKFSPSAPSSSQVNFSTNIRW